MGIVYLEPFGKAIERTVGYVPHERCLPAAVFPNDPVTPAPFQPKARVVEENLPTIT